jgi:hypothetical protein
MEFPGWTDQESIKTYIAGLRDLLQDDDAKQAFDMLLPLEAIKMMSERLIGRFRPVVRAIERIIENGNQEAWRNAIEVTEAKLVSWDLREEPGNLCYEIVRLEDKFRKNLSFFKKLCIVEEALGLLLFQRYMFGGNMLAFNSAVPELVERAFGRIKIVDGIARTVLEEPFVLKAAENYFKMRDSDFMKTMERWVRQSDKPQAHGHAWELMMMTVLTETFEARALSDWPHEPSISSLCAELEGNAEIVGLTAQRFQRGITHEHISMKEFMKAHVYNNSKRGGQAVPPFFFPKAKPSGPDIVFYIRVQDNMFPVFLQLKLRQVMTKPDTKSALDSVSAGKVKKHVKNLSKYCPANTYISMIIAYPANIYSSTTTTYSAKRNVTLRLRPDFNPKSKLEGLKQVVIKVDKGNFAKIFPKEHVNFLDEIKNPMKRLADDE